MTPMNPLFPAFVDKKRRELLAIFRKMEVSGFIYISKHFAERMVERNVDPLDVARMTVPVIKDYRAGAPINRRYTVHQKELRMGAQINLTPVQKRRQISLLTIIDPEVKAEKFDVKIQL